MTIYPFWWLPCHRRHKHCLLFSDLRDYCGNAALRFKRPKGQQSTSGWEECFSNSLQGLFFFKGHWTLFVDTLDAAYSKRLCCRHGSCEKHPWGSEINRLEVFFCSSFSQLDFFGWFTVLTLLILHDRGLCRNNVDSLPHHTSGVPALIWIYFLLISCY